nr:hypothetical protein [Marinicella sp. W31]MDC2878169.1 hypothetical protein [Marinicella sp. W31]
MPEKGLAYGGELVRAVAVIKPDHRAILFKRKGHCDFQVARESDAFDRVMAVEQFAGESLKAVCFDFGFERHRQAQPLHQSEIFLQICHKPRGGERHAFRCLQAKVLRVVFIGLPFGDVDRPNNEKDNSQSKEIAGNEPEFSFQWPYFLLQHSLYFPICYCISAIMLRGF